MLQHQRFIIRGVSARVSMAAMPVEHRHVHVMFLPLSPNVSRFVIRLILALVRFVSSADEQRQRKSEKGRKRVTVSYRVITSPGDDDLAPKPCRSPFCVTPRNNGSPFYSWSTLLFEDPRGWQDPRPFRHEASSRRAERHQHSDLQFARCRRTKRPFYRPAKLAGMRNARCREWKGTPDPPPPPT